MRAMGRQEDPRETKQHLTGKVLRGPYLLPNIPSLKVYSTWLNVTFTANQQTHAYLVYE